MIRDQAEQEKKEKGLQLYPDSRLSKQQIKDMLKLEEKNLRKEERMKVASTSDVRKYYISKFS